MIRLLDETASCSFSLSHTRGWRRQRLHQRADKISVMMPCGLNFSKTKPGAVYSCTRTEQSPRCKKQLKIDIPAPPRTTAPKTWDSQVPQRGKVVMMVMLSLIHILISQAIQIVGFIRQCKTHLRVPRRKTLLLSTPPIFWRHSCFTVI